MEFKPKQELIKTLNYGHDFFNLDASETERLKNRVEKWHGLVRIFVHPMYEKWRGNEEQYANDPKEVKLVQIEQVLAKLLAMPKEKTPPIIIMEEAVYVSKLQGWLKENLAGLSQGGVYFVKTIPNSPTPQLEGENNREVWDKLIKALDDCGVKKILMGGMRLEVSSYKHDWTLKNPYVSRCVGIALSYLSKDKAGKFEVELSGLTDPGSERIRYNSLKQKS
ncbi:MAG: hypothetical protein AAB595_00525 [Patescibacteria group bacterium]